ncbi:hypothetical protein NL676_015721 [Syzygium grande]|nr:hypothetical protein NL676_015721 [Syzygium grande]
MHVKSGVENPRILLLSKPSRGADPRFTVSNEHLVTSLPKSAVTAWSHGGGASCHGLLCFDDLHHGGTYLLNPLTREIVSLSSVGPCKRWLQRRIAIGVDHLTSRYKILRMSSFIGKDRKICSMRAEVLDQGSRSWRDIASVPPCLHLGKPVFTAGSIHSIVTGAGIRVPRILSFDLAKEEFARTPSPEFCEASLVDLRGVLGLVDGSHQESHDVWVMEESGVWVKKYRIPLRLPWRVNSHRFAFFLGCGGRKMVLMLLRSVLSYDPATDELEYVQRGGASLERLIGSITVSLISPAKLWNADKVLPSVGLRE